MSDFTNIIPEFEKWREFCEQRPKSVSYIVLDPSFDGILDAEDSDGRRFILVNSSVMDEMKFSRWCGFDIFAHSAMQPNMIAGISIYRRQDMPEGWPAS